MGDRTSSVDGRTTIWADRFTLFCLPGVLRVYLRFGPPALFAWNASRLSLWCLRAMVTAGLVAPESRLVYNSYHGWRLDSRESLFIESADLFKQFVVGFWEKHSDDLKRLIYPDPRVPRARIEANLRGAISAKVEALMGLSEFARYWQHVHAPHRGPVLLLSKDVIFLGGIPTPWLKEGFIYQAVWDPSISYSLRAMWSIALFWADIFRLRRKEAEGPIRIGVTYHCSVMTQERVSLLHWWAGSGIPSERVVVIFERKDIPCSQKILDQIEKQGIRVVVMKKGALGQCPRRILWQRSGISFAEAFRRLARRWSLLWWGKGWSAWKRALATRLLDLLYLSERAGDLLTQFRIKDLIHYQVGEMDWASVACDLVGGARFREQRSANHWPTLSMACSEHVFLGWGPHDVDALKESGGYNEFALPTGCIVKNSGRHSCDKNKEARGLRQSLEEHKANRILALFDTTLPSEVFFRFFFRHAERDSRWGFVVKPKRTADFWEGMKQFPDVARSLDRLLTEGRLKIAPDYWSPAEAGCAADLSVSWGINTAAVVEAIAGHRSLQLDLLSMHQSSQSRWAAFHQHGGNRLVFTCFSDLWLALKQHYSCPGPSLLGRPTPELIRELDPFQDGAGSLRMGKILAAHLAEMDRGVGWKNSMQSVVREYSEQWVSLNSVEVPG